MNNDPEGVALALIFCLIGLVFCGVALAIERWQRREVRRLHRLDAARAAWRGMNERA